MQCGANKKMRGFQKQTDTRKIDPLGLVQAAGSTAGATESCVPCRQTALRVSLCSKNLQLHWAGGRLNKSCTTKNKPQELQEVFLENL